MAADVSTSSISLRGAAEVADLKPGHTSALILKLDEGLAQDLKRASREKDGLRFTAGTTPKLRIGNRSIDLTISPDDFRTELYASTAAQSRDFELLGLVSHRAVLKSVDRTANDDDTAGSDAALAALKNSLASFQQDRQANQTNITNSILPAPKSRFEAARKEKSGRKNNLLGSQTASPSLSAIGTPKLGQGPTSIPASEDEVKLQAMRVPIVHLLAYRPSTFDSISAKTHVPKTDLDQILQKYGKKVEGKWQLTDRGYRELDVWEFEYPHKDDRQLAIDNAVRAYDRMRLGKDEKLWQMLLPEDERGKGRVLSRLHLGGAPVNRGLTPSYQPSPTPHLDPAGDSKAASAANTPRLGASTPRPSSAMTKRLFAKDPKRAQVAEQAKEKKRKEREAAAGDREGGKPAKKQATQKAVSNAKSAEFVHSSDEESGDEAAITSKPRPANEVPKVKRQAQPAAAKASSADSSDGAVKTNVNKKPAAAHVRTGSVTAKPKDSPALKSTKPVPGKATPLTNDNLSAPSTQHRGQRSPQKHDSRPNVPSPLAAARPRVASDVSDRGAVGVQRVKSGGSDTPKGLGISSGSRRPPTKTDINHPDIVDMAKKKQAAAKQPKATSNGMNGTTSKPTLTNGHKSEAGTKRKADDSVPQGQADTPVAKHHKSNSSSSQSQKSRSDSSGTPHTSPDTPFEGGVGDVAVNVMETISYNQGVGLAEKFLNVQYPHYAKLYDKLEAMMARGETVSQEEMNQLTSMHEVLARTKREIKVASQREHQDD